MPLTVPPVARHPSAGESLAVVGSTGAGKSTIAKLVVRFYDPQSGRVTIDGHDLRDVTLDSLRRQLGVVPQEPFLFHGTFRNNVAFADPDATVPERMNRSLRSSGFCWNCGWTSRIT